MIRLSEVLDLGRGGGRLPVNKTGKIRMSQILVPLAPWIEAMPKSATSEEVSKPRPKRMPRGYIFQGLLTTVSEKKISPYGSKGANKIANRSISLNIFLNT